jgi:hypothetical protein
MTEIDTEKHQKQVRVRCNFDTQNAILRVRISTSKSRQKQARKNSKIDTSHR